MAQSPSSSYAAVDKIIQEAAASQVIPGATAIVYDRAGNIVFETSHGTTNIADPNAAKLTGDIATPFYSGTKLLTHISALQLIEQGKLSIHDLVEDHVSDIKNIQMLEGWDGNGDPILRAPKSKPTVLQLITHTVGLGAEWLHEDSCRYRIWKNDVPPGQYMMGYSQYFKETVLLADPGEKYLYGVGADWLGFVVEAISGMRLDEYVKTNILTPLGLQNSTVVFDPNKPHLTLHWRLPDGSLQAGPEVNLPPDFVPQLVSGGAYLLSTRNDYSTILVSLLNNGTHPLKGVQILTPDSVQELFTDHMPKDADRSEIAVFDSPPSYAPPATNAATLLPGVSKGWSLGLMTASKFGGTSPGAGWAGLGNLYYWIDPNLGRTWLFVTNLLPFMDPDVLRIFDQFEQAVYAEGIASRE